MNIFEKLVDFNRQSFPFLSKTAANIMGIGLPVILLYLCIFLSTALSCGELPGYIIAKKHFDFLEHIVMSGTIIIIGAALVDVEEKRQQREKTQKK